MDRIKKILAPTDLSESSRAGVAYALDLARLLAAEVTAYHVVSVEEVAQFAAESEPGTLGETSPWHADRLLRSYQLALARFLNEHFSDLIPWVRVREKVEFGAPDKNILEWARREGSHLIVISICEPEDSSCLSGAEVAHAIVRHAPCPVLSVRCSRIPEIRRSAVAFA